MLFVCCVCLLCQVLLSNIVCVHSYLLIIVCCRAGACSVGRCVGRVMLRLSHKHCLSLYVNNLLSVCVGSVCCL